VVNAEAALFQATKIPLDDHLKEEDKDEEKNIKLSTVSQAEMVRMRAMSVCLTGHNRGNLVDLSGLL